MRYETYKCRLFTNTVQMAVGYELDAPVLDDVPSVIPSKVKKVRSNPATLAY